MTAVIEHWKTAWDEIPDPRFRLASVQHSLGEILLVVFAGLMCGHAHISPIERWAEHQLEWFRQFYPYKDGIPSHDTMTRVLSRIRPAALLPLLNACFASLSGCVVAMDGKTAKGSRRKDGSVVHIVQAVMAQTRLVLGQETVALKSNEITALPKLIEALDLQGAIVTIDAMGTQHAILKTIVNQGAEAVLALKDNQFELSDSCKTLLLSPPVNLPVFQADFPPEKGHGRLISYKAKGCDIITSCKGMDTMFANWDSLNSVFAIETESLDLKTKEVSHQTRWFVSTQSCTSQEDLIKLADQVRQHWSVEVVHHDLDVLMHEDDAIVRDRQVVENLGLLRRAVLNHLRQVEIPASVKLKNASSMKQRMEMALWSDVFRNHLIASLHQA